MYARHIAEEIEMTQREQDTLGADFPTQRRYYKLPKECGRGVRILLMFLLPRGLYRRIEWTTAGAVFLARKAHELV